MSNGSGPSEGSSSSSSPSSSTLEVPREGKGKEANVNENVVEVEGEKPAIELTDEEIDKKFEEAKALMKEDNFVDAVSLFGDVLQAKYVYERKKKDHEINTK
jgi:hypothetical protein